MFFLPFLYFTFLPFLLLYSSSLCPTSESFYSECFCVGCVAGNFLVSKEPPHRPILLDFGFTMKISSSMKQSLAKMFLATAEVCENFPVRVLPIIHWNHRESV
jgi:hypothetical protein